MWCPFCDRSRQDVGGEQWCDGCNGKFSDEAIEVVGDVAPRRRGRPPREENRRNPGSGRSRRIDAVLQMRIRGFAACVIMARRA
jgi:hypothetical protein